MTSPFSAAGMFVAPELRLGPIRLTPYGFCAAVGLCLALPLSRLSAKLVRLDREKVADAGLLAVVACFVASRLLLVLSDPAAFLKFPFLVLGLPSLTIGGMFLAAAMVWLYLRLGRFPILPMLDAFSVPAATLGACLELGHALDGSEPGMPLDPRWSSAQAWGPDHAVLHPVALYGFGLTILLAYALWQVLRARADAGRPAALALVCGGGLAFALDLLTQPAPDFVPLWLEPGQMMALLAMIGGAGLWTYVSGQGFTRGATPEPRRAAPPALPSAEIHH